MFHVPSFIDDPCLHTFVMVGRITFSVDIFPLVIVLGEIYDLITAAMMWSRVPETTLPRQIYRRFKSQNVIPHDRPSQS